MSRNEINLIHKEAGYLSRLGQLEDKLHVAAWWTLIVLLIAGIGIGASFGIMNVKIKQLENSKVELSRQINAQSIKEGLLLSLKDRVGIASKTLETTKPWGMLFPILPRITTEDEYNSLSVEEMGRVNTNLEVVSVDQAVSVVTNLVTLVDERVIRSPQLLSFSMKEDGSVQLAISFIPIFSL